MLSVIPDPSVLIPPWDQRCKQQLNPNAAGNRPMRSGLDEVETMRYQFGSAFGQPLMVYRPRPLAGRTSHHRSDHLQP